MIRWLWVVVVVAAAGSGDERGWTGGARAAGAPKVLSAPEPTGIVLPAAVASRIARPTVLFYFSPTCPHCRHVADEIEALHRRMTADALGSVLGIVSGASSPAEIAEFEATFHTTFPMHADDDRSVQGAMGARSTPSLMLVAPKPGSKGKLEVRDAWMPFYPGWSALVLGRVTGDPFAAFAADAYLGNNACAACHLEEQNSWQLTHHAVAWQTLVRGGKTGDAACTGCHVTGAGQPTGWDGRADSRFVDVGCEACHGPGGPHDGRPTEAKDTCVACHDAKHAIAFDYGKALPLIDHFAANGMDSAAFDARRRALWAGEVPQALVAMPAGRNVGSSACLPCHGPEHAWWSEDAHANAMASLRPKGSNDPACVRCHATAKVSGPPPTALDGFDRLGGVGCESCHGPGEAHVAAKGGTDNIVGLGESCPVCVIDAVCTSCHTPEWSPQWGLETALEAIAHRPAAR